MKKLPLILTLSRILLIPIFVIIFYLPFDYAHISAAILFTLAAITDWLDGFIARKMKQTTKLGAFLDPVADKLIVSVALVMLVGEPQLRYLAIPAAIIIGREIVISALREWMAELGKRTSVGVSYISKIKTALQMVAVITLLSFSPGSPLWLAVAGYIMLYLAAILTLWTMFVYLKIAWPDLLAKSA